MSILSHKRCSKCGEVKQLDDFVVDRRKKHGKGSRCKDCQNSINKNYRESHPDMWNIWYRANKALSDASTRRYRQDHPEIKQAADQKYRDTHREQKVDGDRRWRQQNPGKAVEQFHRRRARLLNAPGAGFTDSEWQEMKRDYGYVCVYCGQKKPLTQDHIVALDDGGAHEAENIVPACKSCNSGKCTKPLLFYMLHRFKYG